jgi:hypothetical protein
LQAGSHRVAGRITGLQRWARLLGALRALGVMKDSDLVTGRNGGRGRGNGLAIGELLGFGLGLG